MAFGKKRPPILDQAKKAHRDRPTAGVSSQTDRGSRIYNPIATSGTAARSGPSKPVEGAKQQKGPGRTY